MAAGLVQENRTQLRDEKVAIIGSGLIGRSWAMLFACGGYKVALYDTDSAQLKSALSEIESQLRHLAEQGLSRGTLAAEEQISRISDYSSLKDAVCGAAYIQECVPELKELKRGVLQAVSELMEPTAVLASSTSAMMPSLLSDHLYHRGRFTVAHPGNPPFYIPVVEVVPAPWTDADATAKCRDIMADIGQVPVVFLKECDGFAFGRIQFALQAAAYELIKNGYCDVDAVETGMTEGLGMWYAFYGLFQVEHMNADGFVDLCKKYGDAIYGIQTSFEPPELMVGETARKMLADLEEFCPLDQLQAQRKWRDDRLVALARLIKELDENIIQNTEAYGQIGSSWALLFASAGFQVIVYDSDPSAVTRALDIVRDQLYVLEKGHLLRGTLTADQQLERIRTVDGLQKAVHGAIWVQECVPEDLDLKIEVFSKIGQWADNSTILASSTSSFLPSVLSRDLKHKENFLVVHPTNPPFCTRAVELVPAPWTSPDTMTAAQRLMTEIGQAPIVLKKEIAGFVLNRMQFALMAECLRLVKDKVLDVDGVNKMFSAGLGRRYAFMGPFQTAHLNAEGFGSYCERYGPMIHRVQQSFGPAVPPKGEIIENIESELVKQVPLNKLAEARREKELRLIALMKLKKQMDDADVKSS